MTPLKTRFHSLLREAERYTKTDMVYLASSGFWLNLNFIFTSILSLILSVAFASILPKEEYGLYQYVLAAAAFLTAFTFTGMNTSITQAVARGHEGVLRASIRQQLRWNLVPTFLALCACAYHVYQGEYVLSVAFLCIGITLPLVTTFNSYTAFLSGRKLFRISSLYTLAGNSLYYLAIFATLFLVPSALWLLVINLVVPAVVAIYFYRRTLREFSPNESLDPEAGQYAVHISLMNILSTVATHIDKLLVFHFMGPVSLASYALATLLPERLAGGFKPLLVAAFPQFASRDFTQIRGTFFRKSLLVTGVTLMCATVYYLSAPTLLSALYPTYLEIIPYSQVYAVTFVATVGHLAVNALLAHKKLPQLYRLHTFVPITQIALQGAGILYGGIWGLVIARVLGSIIFSIAGVLTLRAGIAD